MKAYRILDDLGSVVEADFDPLPGGVHINRIRVVSRPLEGDRPLRLPPGAAIFLPIERPRFIGRKLVAIIVGPKCVDVDEPDWGEAVLLPVLNSVSAMPGDYTGGWYAAR